MKRILARESAQLVLVNLLAIVALVLWLNFR